MVSYHRNSSEKLGFRAWNASAELGTCIVGEVKVTFVSTVSVKELYTGGRVSQQRSLTRV